MVNPPPPSPHYHLKEAEINSYTGHVPKIELVMYIFSNVQLPLVR